MAAGARRREERETCAHIDERCILRTTTCMRMITAARTPAAYACCCGRRRSYGDVCARACVSVCDDCVWWWGESTRQGVGGGCDGDHAGVCDEMRRRTRRVFQAALLEQCGHEHMVCGSACAGGAGAAEAACVWLREREGDDQASGGLRVTRCVCRAANGREVRTHGQTKAGAVSQAGGGVTCVSVCVTSDVLSSVVGAEARAPRGGV